jgi:energy-coupling factor transporter transmembrane protein EcfT
MQKTGLKRRPLRTTILWLTGSIIFLVIYRDLIINLLRGAFQLKAFFINPFSTIKTVISLTFPGLLFLLFFFFIFFCYLLATSAYVLPVTSLDQAFEIWKRLIAYIFRKHGAAVFIREGKIIGEAAEKQRKGLGVLLIDRKSAAIVEETKKNQKINIQAYRPGMVFLSKKQHIRGGVDLRPQRRSKSDLRAYTKEGIEIVTSVSTSFTLGQAPDVLYVAYHLTEKYPNPSPERLRVVQVSSGSIPPKITQTLNPTITGFSDELDSDDKAEIHRFIQNFHQRDFVQSPYEEDNQSQGEFHIDPSRLIAAFYAQAQQAAPKQPSEWSDLPLQVAIDKFREFLANISFEEIYNPQMTSTLSLTERKSQFSKMIRNQGVLAYQYVQRKDGHPLKVGDVWDVRQLIFFPVQELLNPKFLRTKGIKVLNAYFGELRPSDDLVSESLFHKWFAVHQKHFKVHHAEAEYRTQQIRTEARKQAQIQMVKKFIEIINQSPFSKQALLLQFFETLENAASEPQTHKLLPADTINLIQQLRALLLEEDTRHKSSPGETK